MQEKRHEELGDAEKRKVLVEGFVLEEHVLRFDPFEYDKPLSITVRLRDEPRPNPLIYDVKLELFAPSWADDAARWPSIVRSLRVEPQSSEVEDRLTAQLMRTVKFGKVHSRAHLDAIHHYLKFADPDKNDGPASWARWIRESGPIDSSLKEVALLYRHAESIGAKPVKLITETLNLPRTTATRWVKKARERGFLANDTGD